MYTGKHAHLRPLQPAFIMAATGEAVTYRELEARSNRLAHLLRRRGLKRLDHYAVFMENNSRYLEARMDCQFGTWLSMGALSAGIPMGASHGIGYVLGAVYDVPHGYTSCVMLPSVMRWNKSVNADRQALVSEAMGQPGKDAGDVLDAFIRGLGMPRSLQDVRIGPEHFDRIAEQAMGTPWVPRNPRKIDGPAQVKEILELAA